MFYKVLTKERTSLCVDKNSKYFLTYPKNKEIKAKIGGIFIFGKKDLAKSFILKKFPNRGLIIVPCKARNPRPQKLRTWGACFNEVFEKFWADSDDMDAEDIFRCPKGTFVADSITCLE